MSDDVVVQDASSVASGNTYEDCVYDANGYITCLFNGQPFQATPNETPDQWAELQQLIANGSVTVAAYVPPPPPTQEQLWAVHQGSAMMALGSCDAVIPKIVEAVILGKNSFAGADVVAFCNYRESLRAIIAAPTGDPTAALPVQPPLPVGVA